MRTEALFLALCVSLCNVSKESGEGAGGKEKKFFLRHPLFRLFESQLREAGEWGGDGGVVETNRLHRLIPAISHLIPSVENQQCDIAVKSSFSVPLGVKWRKD